jgi:hypothetical protein
MFSLITIERILSALVLFVNNINISQKSIWQFVFPSGIDTYELVFKGKTRSSQSQIIEMYGEYSPLSKSHASQSQNKLVTS